MNGDNFFKRRIYEIIEVSKEHDAPSSSYDMMMLIGVVVGLLPLTMKNENVYCTWIDLIVGVIFIFDYAVRLYTADYKMGVKSYKAYIAYAMTPMAIVDLLSIVPMFSFIIPMSKTIQIFRLFRIFRVFRVLKLIRYSKTMITIQNVLRRVKGPLFAVLILTIVYITASAMMIYQLEPDTFNTFFDALYWATISITTIGYGDYSPVTVPGRIITMLSSLAGMAVIALPSGIITAAYMEEIKRKKTKLEL